MFFKRQPRESPDELANRLQREGRTADLEGELKRYTVSRLNPKDKESYFHLWGITAFQKRDREEAYRRFNEGLEECPDSQNLLFSLGQEYEYRREIDRMFDCFDRCSFPTVPAPIMLAAARYAYLWDRPDKGIRYIKPIAYTYFTVGIADDHFLFVRGLPFFDQTWTYFVAFALMQGDFAETDAYFGRACKELSDYDFDSARLFYDCVKKDDYTPAIGALESRVANWDSRFPSGYPRIQLAALKARMASETDVVALFHDVHLAANDFPWLADVVTIHRAWAFRRADDSRKEAEELDRFFAKQGMLFEPDHAVAFAFFPYQEMLKPRYQNKSV